MQALIAKLATQIREYSPEIFEGKCGGKQKEKRRAEGNYDFIGYRQRPHDWFEKIKPGKIHEH